MKNTILIIAISGLFSIPSFAQSKKDTTHFEFKDAPSKERVVTPYKDTIVQVTMTLPEFKSLLQAIDGSIDSKRTTNEINSFLLKNAKLEEKPTKK